jgi:hypothetical protein
MLTLASSLAPQEGDFARRYEWTHKQMFALSVAEVGTLLATLRGGGVEGDRVSFNRASPQDAAPGAEASLYKQLSLARRAPPQPGALGTVEISLAVQDRPTIECAVDLGSWAAFEELMKFSLPRLTGFDMSFAARDVEGEFSGQGQAHGGPRETAQQWSF